MKKRLPALLQNDIISFNNYALPLCVINGNNKEEWILEHFGNIYCQKSEDGYIMLDFLEQYDYPKDVLEYKFLTYQEYSSINDIISHIKERIEHDYQVMIIVDNDCLYEKREHPLRHFPMQIYIYGYDDEIEMFFGMGYRSDFTFGDVSYRYEEVRHAYQSFCKYYEIQNDWISMYAEIYMKVKEPLKKYRSSSGRILQELKEYYKSEKCMDKIRPEFLIEGECNEFVFGKEAQDIAVKALYKLLDGEFKTDYRLIHLLYEHKKMVYRKIEKLVQVKKLEEGSNDLKKEYQKQVVKKINKARLIFMMQVIDDNGQKQFYAQLKNKEAILAIIKLLEEAIEKEEEILQKIMEKENRQIYGF